MRWMRRGGGRVRGLTKRWKRRVEEEGHRCSVSRKAEGLTLPRLGQETGWKSAIAAVPVVADGLQV